MTAGVASFVLVPGAMHGSWVWDRVRSLIEAPGHRTAALDLPGMGDGRDPLDVTLADWGEFVADAVRAAEPPVILVGHSRGGLVIGEAAERVPERVAGLIYVTALIVPPGRTSREVAGAETSNRAGISFDDSGLHILPPAIARAMFYNDCADADAKAALARLCPEPPRPMDTPATVTWQRWGRIPRGFIGCRNDRTLSVERQRLLIAGAPCNPVIELDADHSPFLCVPEQLASAMLAMSNDLLAQSRTDWQSRPDRAIQANT